jgi:uncharacterized protein YlxW (UPF0749 family)
MSVGLIAVLCIFGIPLSAIWTSHRRQVLELQLRLRNEGGSSVQAEVEALRQEVRNLRDTTMQYDLSFDTALQRMEQRMESMERRVNSTTTGSMAELQNGR